MTEPSLRLRLRGFVKYGCAAADVSAQTLHSAAAELSTLDGDPVPAEIPSTMLLLRSMRDDHVAAALIEELLARGAVAEEESPSSIPFRKLYTELVAALGLSPSTDTITVGAVHEAAIARITELWSTEGGARP